MAVGATVSGSIEIPADADFHGANLIQGRTYQITLGGAQGNQAQLGKVIGPSFPADEVPNVIEKMIHFYLAQRHEDERFIDTVHRLGVDSFKIAVYGNRARIKSSKEEPQS